MNHQEIQELLGAFALDAVDSHEYGEIATHLENCDSCADEVGEYREVAGLLGGGGEAPARLWDAIAASAVVPHNVLTERHTLAPPLNLAAFRPRSNWTSSVSTKLRAALAVAAVAIVLAGAAGLQMIRLQSRVDNLSTITQQQGLGQVATAALLNPADQHIALTSATSRSSLAELVVLPSGQAFLINRSLSTLAQNQTYQLWGIDHGQAISLGLLGPHPTTLAISVARTSGVRTYAVTIEQSGGVVAPDHAPIASGESTAV